jgi:hypothetical protein
MSKNNDNIDTNDKDSLNNKDKESIDLENGNLTWSPTIDQLLAAWCDNAKCFEWMHLEAFNISSSKARKFMIATNLLTAISGLSNIITGGYQINGFQIAWIFGSLSILTSSLNMLQDKLGYQSDSEKHRKLSNQWGIIRNKIEEVIILPPNARRDCKTFLRYIKADINQASIDGNSLIPENVRISCYEKYKNIPNFDIPDICGKMEHTKVFIDIKDNSPSKDKSHNPCKNNKLNSSIPTSSSLNSQLNTPLIIK